MTTEICSREGCENPFEKRVWNQRFCSTQCARIYTNERILAAYYEKKAKKEARAKSTRICPCGTILSRYNENDLCALCHRRALDEEYRAKGWKI